MPDGDFWREYKEEILVVVSIVVGLLVIGVALFSLRETQVEVVEVRWRREIQVENFLARRYEDWEWSVPNDAYERNCYQAIHHWDRVRSGETCTTDSDGDRTCTTDYTSVPVWRTQCDYTADRWDYHRSLVSQAVNRSPFWLELDFVPCGSLGCEREGRRIENYAIWLTEDTPEDHFECPYPESQWAEFRVGDRYHMTIGRFLPIPRCETIKRGEL